MQDGVRESVVDSSAIMQETIPSINPRTGESIGEFTSVSPSQVPEIVQKAETAFDDWSNFTLRTRLELFKKAYVQFLRYQDELAEIIALETGKPLVEAYSSEVMPVLECFKYYKKNIHKILKPKTVQPLNPLLRLRKGIVSYEPIGVIVLITPWNYPFLLTMHQALPAILAGNVVLHKPSEFTTLTALKVREVFDEAYLPQNVFKVVPGLTDVGAALTSSKVAKILFTGSTEVGKKIYTSAADNLVPVNLELGGSDPMIVLEDADLERASNAAVWGAFCNAGQACISVERLYVNENIYDDFLAKLIEKTRKIRPAIEQSVEGEMSSLINESQFDKVQNLVADAVEKGAEIEIGGDSKVHGNSYYFQPTILSKVASGMRILSEEAFGPIVSVIPFITDEEAVFMANQSRFGLSASIWTSSRKKAQSIAHKLQVGGVLINELMTHVAQMEAPYSGRKDSGFGVSHGPWGVMEMVRPKFITMDRPVLQRLLNFIIKPLAKRDVWWFPYDSKRINEFRAFAELLHNHRLSKRIKALPVALKALFRRIPPL